MKKLNKENQELSFILDFQNFIKKMEENILFDFMEVDKINNIVNISIMFKNELKLINSFLKEFFNKNDYELINFDNYHLRIIFNKNIGVY